MENTTSKTGKLRVFETKNQYFEVRQTEKGVFLYDEDNEMDQGGWAKICCFTSAGTSNKERIQAFLERTEVIETDKSFREWVFDNNLDKASIFDRKEKARVENIKRQAQIETELKKEIQNDYNNLIEGNEVVETNRENLKTVMKYLNTLNWGVWQLPKMSIGYSAHQYDCDGKTATTVELDEPLDGQTKFKIGGKRGHLNGYRNI